MLLADHATAARANVSSRATTWSPTCARACSRAAKNRKNLVQIIRKNFGLKVLALTLAIVGWAYFRYATNPIVAAARFDQQISVPIYRGEFAGRLHRAFHR